MSRPRSSQIALNETSYFHCTTRCVRRAYLCGYDSETGTNYDHRKQWIVNRIKQLASIFAIEIASYSIMDNHYHIALRVNEQRMRQWTDDEILSQWHLICEPKPIVDRYVKGQANSPCDHFIIDKYVKEYRERLISISWFMYFLNFFIARQANKEDDCTGHFFEGRFHSQAMLDETALLATMVYVDLNPIRAKMAELPETSDFTSIQERLGIKPDFTKQNPKNRKQRRKAERKANKLKNKHQFIDPLAAIPPAPLLPFAGHAHKDNNPIHIPFALRDYLELVDWTGRQLHPGKRGFIDSKTPDILARLNITKEHWLAFSSNIRNDFCYAVGDEQHIRKYSTAVNISKIAALKSAQQYYPPPE